MCTFVLLFRPFLITHSALFVTRTPEWEVVCGLGGIIGYLIEWSKVLTE
jgi:hypothetical protein